MDIIEQAFATGNRPRNWEHLARWLRANAAQVNGVPRIVAASERAMHDGVRFPDSAEEARWIIRKYRDMPTH